MASRVLCSHSNAEVLFAALCRPACTWARRSPNAHQANACPPSVAVLSGAGRAARTGSVCAAACSCAACSSLPRSSPPCRARSNRDLCLGLRHARVELLNRTAGGRLDRRRFAHRGGEGLVQFVVCPPHRLLRQVDLLLRLREARHLPRGIEQPAVHYRYLCGRANRRGVARQPCGHEACRQHQDDNAREDFSRPCHANPCVMRTSKVVHS